MTLHLGLNHHHHRSAEQQHEIREAKRILRDRVRDDWDYPALPKWQIPARESSKTSEKSVGGFRFHVHSEAEREGQEFEAQEWRERDYSSSDSDVDDEAVARKKSKDKAAKGDYKFEGPESVGAEISKRKLARKRRRRELLEEEMTWNDGLSHFMARRDAWAGARTAEQIHALEARRGEDSASTSASAGSTPRTSTSSATAHSTSTAATSPSPTAIHISGMAVPSPSNILIPVLEPILPNHPIRKRLSPAMYPEIYTKIILQSRTPSVPINLAPMVQALVQGWKDDGEWPPKPGVPEKSVAKKKVPVGGLKDGVKTLGKHLLGMSGGEVLARERG